MCILETTTEDLIWSLLLPAERLLLPAKAADGHGMLASCPRWHDFTVKFPADDCSSDAGSPLGDRKPVPPWLLPLVQVPVLKGTSGELQLSLADPKNALLSGGHCCWAHAVAFLAQPPLQARPSGLLPTKLTFSQNNYVDFYRETFSRCDALPLGALQAPLSIRAGTGLVEIFTGALGAPSYIGWMCRESTTWFRGTAQTRGDAFSLEQRFSTCG